MSKPSLASRESRRGMFNNSNRWRNKEQAIAEKKRKHASTLRRHLKHMMIKSCMPLREEEMVGLPPELISQLSRDVRRVLSS